MGSFKVDGAKRSDLHVLPVDSIVVDKDFNLRADYGDLEQLAASIEESGVRTPLTVRQKDGVPVLVDGHRRLRAIELLKSRGVIIEMVPCIPVPKGANEADLVADLIRRNDGLKFTPLEEGLVMRKLRDVVFSGGKTQREISKLVGRREGDVSNYLKLADADPRIQTMLRKKTVETSTVLTVLRAEDDPDKQVAILAKQIEKAKEKGKKKATAKAVEDELAKEGKVAKERSRKAMLQEFYAENFAEMRGRKTFLAVGLVLSYLDKEIDLAEFASKLSA